MRSQSTKFVWAGAWLITTYKGFAEFDLYEPVFDQYEATILSARAANLLSSIRHLRRVKSDEFELRRRLAKIKPSEILPLVSQLEELNILNVEWMGADRKAIRSVEARNTSRRGVFEAAGRLFYELTPTNQEHASLLSLDLTAVMPVRITMLVERIERICGIPADIIFSAINHLVSLGLLHRTRETVKGDPIISNPYAFRSIGEDSVQILSSLSQIRPEKAFEILEYVKNNPGVPFPKSVDINVLNVLVNVGLIDHSGITVKGSTQIREFPTMPHLWGVFETAVGNAELDSDLVDDAKLFLNSIRYGEYYSHQSRGKIDDPIVLVDRLISRGEVGPATAIGADYPLPLSRGIVSIVESIIHPGRYHMQLRKVDVAKSVLDILQQGTVLRNPGAPNEMFLQTSGQYKAPEALRVTRELPPDTKMATEELAFALRSHRKN